MGKRNRAVVPIASYSLAVSVCFGALSTWHQQQRPPQQAKCNLAACMYGRWTGRGRFLHDLTYFQSPSGSPRMFWKAMCTCSVRSLACRARPCFSKARREHSCSAGGDNVRHVVSRSTDNRIPGETCVHTRQEDRGGEGKIGGGGGGENP